MDDVRVQSMIAQQVAFAERWGMSSRPDRSSYAELAKLSPEALDAYIANDPSCRAERDAKDKNESIRGFVTGLACATYGFRLRGHLAIYNIR